MARWAGFLVLTLMMVVAGCATPPAAPPAGVPAPADDAAGDDAEPRNLWLLDAPRPFTTTVSNGGAEPSILVTKDGSAIFIGDHFAVYRSLDAGASWKRLANPMIETFFIHDGIALAEDDEGTIYIADTNGPIVGFAASHDRGTTWALQNKIVEVGAIVDRPWLAARGDGDVVLITNTIRAGQREECARTQDGGQTWLSRSLANAASPNAGNVVFDSRGRVWFSNGEELWRWSEPCGNSRLPVAQPTRGAQILTQVAVDAQDRVYFAQPNPDNSEMVLWAYTPTNGQFTPLTVSGPALQSNTFGTLSIRGDEIAVGWYGSETPGDPSQPSHGGAWNVYVARVTGFWSAEPTIRHDRITTEPNHIGGFCMGGTSCDTPNGPDRDLLDYFMVDHGPDGALHIAYGHDGATSNPQVRYARLAP